MRHRFSLSVTSSGDMTMEEKQRQSSLPTSWQGSSESCTFTRLKSLPLRQESRIFTGGCTPVRAITLRLSGFGQRTAQQVQHVRRQTLRQGRYPGTFLARSTGRLLSPSGYFPTMSPGHRLREVLRQRRIYFGPLRGLLLSIV